MNLFSNDHPETTLKGLQFKDKELAIESIKKIDNYFKKLEKKQKIPGESPSNLRPQIKIENKQDSNKFYKKQAMWRIIALWNRAKVFLKKTKPDSEKHKNYKEVIEIFNQWMEKYHQEKKLNSKI